MISVKLNVVSGKHTGQVIPLNRKKFLIGREQDCQLRPNSELVSRHHCIFTVDDYSVRVRDLGSTNGTLVNGERIQKEIVLKQTDRVIVGSLEFEVQINEVTKSAVSSAGSDTGELSAHREDTVVAGAETMADMKIADPAATSDQQFSGAETSEQPAQEAPEAAEAPAAAPEAPPAPPQEAPQVGTGDTTVIAQPMMMPGQPYQPMMPQMGYPPMYGGGYPYPGMMPMYPQQQGYPGMMPQQHDPYQQAAAPAPTEGAPGSSSLRDVSLPDPSETGAKDEPKKAEPEQSGDQEKKQEAASNQSAAAIIQQHMKKRPGG